MRKDGEEALRGHDPDPLPADVDQAVVLQFLERPGESLRDGPQPGGEDVLPDRKIELRPVPRGDAARLELLRKVEDQTRLHVPQGEAFREFGHPLEPAGEGRQHPDRHVRPPLEELDERALREEQQLRVGERLGVRGKDPPLEDHRLGERLTRFQDVEDLLLPLPGELEHLHLAGRDDAEPLGALPLPADRLLLRESPRYGEVGDPSQVVVGQGGEQRRLPEDVHRPGGHGTILMDRRAASRRDFLWRIRSPGEVGGMAKVGFVGLGIMGEPMCRNLLAKGHAVTVFNRTPAKMGSLVAAGANAATSLPDLVLRSDIIITMVSDPAAVRDVVTAKSGGFLGALSPGKTYIDMTTVSPDASREIARMVRETGADYLEAPVLGSRKPATEGTLVILTGGDAGLSRRMEPLLLAMGRRVIHMGDTGMAAHMKLIINQIMGTILCVFAEGALVGMEAGLSAKKILAVLQVSVVACPAIQLKGADMLGERVFTPSFPLKHAHKDLRLAVETGKAMKIPTPVTKAACDLFGAARDKGFGDRDISAVVRALTDQ